MIETKDMQKIYNIIDEFDKKFSPDGNNEFMIEFAERNLKEFINDADNIILGLNNFTDNNSLKIAVYVYIFGLLFSALNSDNSTVIDRINITLSLIVELLSEANDRIRAEREIGYVYRYALEKRQGTVLWHKYPEDEPKKDGDYLITTINGGLPEVATESYKNGFKLDAFVIAWAEKPMPYMKEQNG